MIPIPAIIPSSLTIRDLAMMRAKKAVAVVNALVQSRGVSEQNIIVPRSSDCDLRNLDNCIRAVENCQIVIHLAARTGGIAFSRKHPASQYYDCMLMNLNILEASQKAGGCRAGAGWRPSSAKAVCPRGTTWSGNT